MNSCPEIKSGSQSAEATVAPGEPTLSADTARTPPECVLLAGEGSQPHHHTFSLSLSGLVLFLFLLLFFTNLFVCLFEAGSLAEPGAH